MITGGCIGDLELRRAKNGKGRRLKGRFPYGKRAVLSDGGRRGRPRKEEFAPRAFSYRVERPEEDIHLLVGHSYDRPLASRAAGTLEVFDSDEALTFEAVIKPELEEVTYVRDALAAIEAGLLVGISPGFRIPPERAVKKAEAFSQEEVDPSRGMHGAIIRTIFHALLYELSIVTVPAYKETEVEEEEEERSWPVSLPEQPSDATLRRALNRWRA